ncbi:hypothetical protein RvY_07462-2 [Ramazzottius varieornatus]|uniref:Transmembrane protein n=1 Tax=Ramazzottius varieornatus TaxID=947166 RepID=A0A1D1V294_RAMVA|nr:hypothetical protein RvY_07462-2 [Ramazzottius varieornatus]
MDSITCGCTYCRRRTNACLNGQTSGGRCERSNTAPASSLFSTSSVMDFVSTMAGDAFKRNDRVRRESVAEGGGEEERQLRTALLNGFGQFFIVILVYVGYQVYQLLDPFLRPLSWALLVGIVLYPFKMALARWGKNWVNHLKATDTPLAVGILRVPLGLTDTALEHVGGIVVGIVKEHTVLILWAGVFYSLGGLFNFMIYVFNIDVIAAMYLALGLVVTIAASNWVWVIVLAHGFALIFYWNSENEKETIINMATPVYLALAIHLTAWFGIIAVPLVLFCGAVLVIGLAAEARTLMQRFRHHKTQALHQEKIAEWGRFAALSPWNFSWWPLLVKVQTHITEGQLAVDPHSSRADLDGMATAGDTTDPAESITEAEDSQGNGQDDHTPIFVLMLLPDRYVSQLTIKCRKWCYETPPPLELEKIRKGGAIVYPV